MLGCDVDGTQAIFAASGTDLFVLAGQWLRPGCTVMVDPAETGSGMPLALRGRHFDSRTANGATPSPGTPIGDWDGCVRTLAVRHANGSARRACDIDADCAHAVDAAIGAGKRVLLVLTDVSKTGMIVPSIDCALALRQRWPDQVDILVDACQFRMSASTVRAYLAHDCLVALTGSKFLGGPTFCGTLLVPAASVARLRHLPLAAACAAYSNAAEWPPGWAASDLPPGSNWGLLLRWQAALAELRRFQDLPAAQILADVNAFAAAVQARLEASPLLEAVPVPPLQRAALSKDMGWDASPTIFPFLVLSRAGDGLSRPLTREQMTHLHVTLRDVPGVSAARYALGQPVVCGQWHGEAVSALRLCLGAPSLTSMSIDVLIGHAMAALDRVEELAAAL